jgi:hypothetical protein
MRGRFNDQIVDIAAVEFDSQLGLQPPVVHNFAARKEIHEPTPRARVYGRHRRSRQ